MATDNLGSSALKREGYVKKYWESISISLNQNPTFRLADMQRIDLIQTIILEDGVVS